MFITTMYFSSCCFLEYALPTHDVSVITSMRRPTIAATWSIWNATQKNDF